MNYRNIATRYIGILIIGVLIASCDLTEMPQDTASKENVFNDEIGLELYTNSFYNILPSANNITRGDEGRDPRSDVMDKVLADIDFAIENIRTETDASRTLITKDVALALKSRIALLTSCGSNATVATTPDPENESAGIEHPDALRVFVYNIQHGRGLDGEVNIERIADVIREKDPHLVALNEVDVGVERSGNIDIMALLADYLNMEPVFGKNIPHQGGEYGNGILTNLPLLSSENLHLDMPDEGEQRGLLQSVVEFNGVKIAFMTTHLDHRSDINRQVAVEEIIETKQNYPGMPVLATGDFNARPDDGIIGRMKVNFNDAWDEVGEGPGYTIPVPAASANRRIDYIFYTNNLVEEGEPTLRPIHMEVIDSSASDHLPIYAAFELVD